MQQLDLFDVSLQEPERAVETATDCARCPRMCLYRRGVEFAPRYVVNRHGVVLNPDVIEFDLPRKLRVDAAIRYAETATGTWAAGESATIEIALNRSGQCGTGNPVSIYSHTYPTAADAIHAAALRINRLFEAERPSAAEAFWNLYSRQLPRIPRQLLSNPE